MKELFEIVNMWQIIVFLLKT